MQVLGAWHGCLRAEPPAGFRGRALGQGIRGSKPPKAETFLAFGRSMDAANLLIFLKFGNVKIRYFCCLCKTNEV